MSKTIRKINPSHVINPDSEELYNMEELEEMPKREKTHLTKKVKKIDKKHYIVKAADGAEFGEINDFDGDPISDPLHKKGLKKEKIRKERRRKFERENNDD